MKKKKKIIIGILIILIVISLGIYLFARWQKDKELHKFLLKPYISDKIVSKVRVGDTIKVALYYIPGKDYENGLQTSIKYSKGLKPIYDGEELKIDTGPLTTYKKTDEISDKNKKETNWIIIANDVKKDRKINFVGLDFEALSTMDKEGVLAYVYFKVDDSAKDKITINFDKKKTVISNYREFKTKDLVLKVEK